MRLSRFVRKWLNQAVVERWVWKVVIEQIFNIILSKAIPETKGRRNIASTR